ncbi:MAG: FHA domain-containing protein [Candidatus Caenarcaniphilales bacterium]|nr:FHA domain-containing protein [Candidatus Caenarcaniphilales bacterium]
MQTWSVVISGQVIPLDSANVKVKNLLVGRDEKSHIYIDSDSVSRYHSEIRRSKSDSSKTFDYFIRDLASVNGTFIKVSRVNERGVSNIEWDELEPGRIHKLSSGDTFRFGDTELTFTFKEEYSQTGEVYLAEILHQQNEIEEEYEEVEYSREESYDAGNQLVSRVLEIISKNNPFKK